MDYTLFELPGFTTSRDKRRFVFTSPGQVIVGRITDAELATLAARGRRDARGAWGGHGKGEYLLSIMVQEAVLTFEGSRGELVLEDGRLRAI